ncbi:MAG: nucleotidyl transferase AbiEii/AbiGii toxin family protein [Candidatus Tenebribacter davisii]|jgi:predicted nucleotidyltransferase component of viral defense system|nr:nucleotidyl transferase AbiEii/AbiGii toxin family protein [Candidatus Tenebribacter davisii]
MMQSQYFKQANLLIRILPFLARESDFALKGGTALNFFIRNFPRLSVDIDITYLPINKRETAFQKIALMLLRYSTYIKKIFPNSKVTEKKFNNDDLIKGLIVSNENTIVKIEPNFVIRGSVFPAQNLSLTAKAKEIFQKDVKVQILSTADLYAGKICAALDRQHPRDLFDITKLLENEGITDSIRKAFIVYLLSHPRPIVELLNPNRLDISHSYKNEFIGMTSEVVSLDQLIKTRDDLIAEINAILTEDDKQFILSFKNNQPKWKLLGIEHVKDLPAIKWKLYNLAIMPKQKHKIALDKLSKHLKVDY